MVRRDDEGATARPYGGAGANHISRRDDPRPGGVIPATEAGRPSSDQDGAVDRVVGRPPGLVDYWPRVVAYDRVHPELADSLAAAALAAATAPWLVTHTSGHAGIWALDAGLLLPLAWRRRRPVAVFTVVATVAFVQWVVNEPLAADASLLLAVLAVGDERPLRTGAAAWAVLEVGVVLASVSWGFGGSWFRSLVALSGLATVAFLLGAALRSRRARLAELTERAARLEVERDQQVQLAAAAERTRIAREMHDVIAHSLAVIVAMADGASAKLAREPERAGAAIQAVADVGREALGETRRLLGVLRDQQRTPGLAPQPGLGQLDELVGQLRATGLDAGLELAGRRFEVPPSAELTVYRIVQEAATNTLKHAPGARSLRIRVSFERPRLRVEVLDDGPSRAVTTAAPPSGGHGIPGMRERVALYSGHVDAGPAAGGGWAVRATLTVQPAAP